MDSNDKFGLAGLVVIAAIIITIAICVTVSGMQSYDIKAEAIKNGISPMEVACAFDDHGNTPVCIILATNKGK